MATAVIGLAGCNKYLEMAIRGCIKWMHLRLCLTCGHAGCSDDAKYQHATKHFHATGHPIIQWVKPGEGRELALVLP